MIVSPSSSVLILHSCYQRMPLPAWMSHGRSRVIVYIHMNNYNDGVKKNFREFTDIDKEFFLLLDYMEIKQMSLFRMIKYKVIT